MAENERAMAGFVSACMPPEMKEELRELADRESINISGLIRQLLTEWMKEQRAEKPLRYTVKTEESK